MTYSVKQPYLRNHTLHDFHKSLDKEKSIIEGGQHFSVLHSLNLEFEKKGLSIDFDSFEDNYGQDSLSQFRNKAGVDASFNIVKTSNRQIVKEGYTIDYKFRDKNGKFELYRFKVREQPYLSSWNLSSTDTSYPKSFKGIKLGEWNVFKIGIKNSKSEDGFMKVFINEEKVLDYGHFQDKVIPNNF